MPASKSFILLIALFFVLFAPSSTNATETADAVDAWCDADTGRRVVCADIAALDQTLVYNRFGSFNPYGMIFALTRDLVPLSNEGAADAVAVRPVDCAEDTGTTVSVGATGLAAGQVRLRDCKRARPLTLRANVGDRLVVRVTNLLHDPARDVSHGFCAGDQADDALRAEIRGKVAIGDQRRVDHGEALCRTDADASGSAPDGNWPATRLVNFVAQGLTPVEDSAGNIHPACRGTGAVEAGYSFVCIYDIPREAPYFFASLAAPAGGQGDGGSLVHGLFGAVVGERAGSTWYRSQVSHATLDKVWPRAAGDRPLHSRTGGIDYDKIDEVSGMPYLNMLRAIDVPQSHLLSAPRAELVHSDLNGIVYCGANGNNTDCPTADKSAPGKAPVPAFREFSVFFHDELKTFYTRNFEELGQFGQLAGVRDGFAINYGASGMGSLLLANRKGIGPSAECMECLYEEFFLTSWANGDPALLERFDDDPSNVHHSYMNDPVVFRNFHAGPKETHVFHLHAHQWFGGNDPDRGSYLDSQTVAPQQGFTYNIYHGGRRDNAGNGQGYWGQQGSGNRNRTVGDSIFHCHLYPHFAQGMWALWRVHDVLEDGTRKLPDGQADDGLSLDFADQSPEFARGKRSGSVDPQTGAWIADARGTPVPALIPLPGEPLPLLPSYANDPNWDPQSDAVVAEGKAPVLGYPYFIGGEVGHRPPQAPLDIARELVGAATGDTDARPLGDGWLDGGLPRHVVLDGSTRKPPFALPVISPDDPMRATLLRQAVAKAFALGDLTEKLTRANIRLLDNAGTALERAAMGFHYNGAVYDPDGGNGQPLRLIRADGTDSTYKAGTYNSLLAPVPASAAAFTAAAAAPPPASPGEAAPTPAQTEQGKGSDKAPLYRFAVNGSAPKPGAPFADPCGVPARTAGPIPRVDPLYSDQHAFQRDPYLSGFRRYETSAVQLDLIVNSAGWHDPQARINVLTADSLRFKDRPGTEGRISPLISDREEPFFFRALSGECIEFRHTNELPKDLELDDFQVRTPTDTIGQHIHLVKFDVTSSDGSGNGWNYEDGTFAADEIALRRCASTQGTVTGGSLDIAPGECLGAEPAVHDIWRLPLDENRDRFQTTVQRWFADPILSKISDGGLRDRTMRTVFSHDHFGPSSIQQHGFYSALLVEPRASFVDGKPQHDLEKLCDTEGDAACYRPLKTGEQLTTVAAGTKMMTGTRKLVAMKPANGTSEQWEDPNFREFALSVADFALLYDPRDRVSERDLRRGFSQRAGEKKGMARLYCEALWRLSPWPLDAYCGAAMERGADFSWFAPGGLMAPAWVAAGQPGDRAHNSGQRDLLRWTEVFDLRRHLVSYRERAAGMDGGAVTALSLAQPVAAPERPESISVDHHDPYLVNYRGAPIPLRIGNKAEGTAQSADCAPKPMGRAGQHDGTPSAVEDALRRGTFPLCSFDWQLTGAKGDMGLVFSSRQHGDPETPLLEAYGNERLLIRLIQGAQEVQHGFRILGKSFRRNPDQAFSQGMLALGQSQEMKDNPTRHRVCADALASGRPEQYALWQNQGLDGIPAADKAHWERFETLLAQCDNAEGMTFLQEIGISEHFEMQGSLRADFDASLERAPTALAALAAPTAVDDAQSVKGVSDLLYDFGSIDALWNGAWGLVRTYDSATTLDPVGNRPVGDRLKSLANVSLESVEVQPSRAETPDSGLTCPITSGTSRRAVIAAVTTRDLFGRQGTPYAGPRHDPDGLMLAVLPASAWPGGGFWDSIENWKALDRDALIVALRDHYASGPVPFLMRVNAGDCVELRLVNLMSDTGDFAGLRDLLGDARMPPIVPLNVDPQHGATEGAVEGDVVRAFDLARAVGPTGGMRPSAQMALRIGLPGLDLLASVPSGVGYMADPIPPIEDGKIGVSQPLTFFAGRARSTLNDDGVQRILDDLRTAITTAQPDAQLTLVVDGIAAGNSLLGPYDDASGFVENPTSGLVSMLGKHYALVLFLPDGSNATIAGADSAETASARQVLCAGDAACEADFDTLEATLFTTLRAKSQIALNDSTHWIPYAFGAVPVTSVADMISHTPHGLFGAIDVVPSDWDLSEAGYAEGPQLPGEPRPVQVLDTIPPGDGMPLVIKADKQPPLIAQEPEVERIREFVLFYQDGISLRDADSQTVWRWDDTGRIASDPDGLPVNTVADCHVCDDSYDLGETGINYRSVSFAQALRDQTGVHLEDHDDLQLQKFPPDFFPAAQNAIRLQACEGEQVVIRVIHPGGRARQRAFVMNGYGYEDLFPGFGFSNASLLAPGKSATAWLTPRMKHGIAIWHDGPLTRRAGGAWGLLDVKKPGEQIGNLACPDLP